MTVSRNSTQPLCLHVAYFVYVDEQIFALESVCSMWVYVLGTRNQKLV